MKRRDAGCWHKADNSALQGNVCFRGNSRHASGVLAERARQPIDPLTNPATGRASTDRHGGQYRRVF
jgi:hypothetical protein